MRANRSKVWWVALISMGIFAVGIVAAIRGLKPTATDLAVERVLQTKLVSVTVGYKQWDQGIAELVELGPDAIPAIVKRAERKGNWLEKVYARVLPELPDVLRRRLPAPRDYNGDRAVVMKVLADHGIFAARAGYRGILDNLSDSNAMPAIYAREALNWVLLDSAEARTAVSNYLNSATPRNGFGLSSPEEVWVGMTDMVPSLVKLLKNRDVGYHAAISLRTMGSNATQAVPELVKVIEAKSDPYDKAWSSSPGSDQFSHRRAMAAKALGAVGATSPDVVRALTRAWNDTNAWVRENAAESIGKLADAFVPCLPELIIGLEDGENRTLRSKIDTIGRFGRVASAALPVLDRLSATNLLAKIVNDPETQVVESSVRDLSLLAKMAAARIEPARTQALIPELIATWGHLSKAVAFLTNSPAFSDDIVSACEAVIDDPRINVHHKAELVVLAYDPENVKARASLKRVLRTGTILDRLLAARWLLVSVGQPDGIDTVIADGLNGPNSGVRQGTVELVELLMLRGNDMREWVEKACWNSDKFVRARAGRLLQRYYPERLPPLGEP